MTEEQILIGCKKGDRRCQNALYKNYFGLMSSIALRYCDDDNVMERVNAGFLKILSSIKNYNDEYSFSTWIRTIMVRDIIDHYRKTKNYKKHIHLVSDDIDDYSGDTLNHGELKLQVDDLRKMLKSLPPITEKVFNLFAIDGFTHKEIAEVLGMKEGTSKWHLSDARRRLRLALKTIEKKENKRKEIRNEAY